MKHSTLTTSALALATAALLSGCQGMPSEAEIKEQVEIVHANVDELAALFGDAPVVARDYVVGCDIEIGDPGEEVRYMVSIPMDRATFLTIAEQLPTNYQAQGWDAGPIGDGDAIAFRRDDLHMSATFRPRRDEVSITGTTGCRH